MVLLWLTASRTPIFKQPSFSDHKWRTKICLEQKLSLLKKISLLPKVEVQVTVPVIVIAVITKESVEDLDIKVDDEVQAIVKSTEVMDRQTALNNH